MRVRPGWVPPEERPKYQPPARRTEKPEPEPPAEPVPEQQIMYITRPYYGKYPSQMTDEEVDVWLKERAWLRPLPK